MPVGNSVNPRNSCLDSRHSVKITKKIKVKVKEIRMRDKSQKACQFVSLLMGIADVTRNKIATQAKRMTTARMKRIVLIGFSAMVLLSTGSGQSHGQTRSPSFQYVATAGGELRGMSTPYTAHPGSRQFVYFSNDKLTIAAAIEVEDISAAGPSPL